MYVYLGNACPLVLRWYTHGYVRLCVIHPGYLHDLHQVPLDNKLRGSSLVRCQTPGVNSTGVYDIIQVGKPNVPNVGIAILKWYLYIPLRRAWCLNASCLVHRMQPWWITGQCYIGADTLPKGRHDALMQHQWVTQPWWQIMTSHLLGTPSDSP